jgi:predicted transcriptional regulator
MVEYRQRIGYLLSKFDGNISAVARETGMSRRQIRRILTGKETARGRDQSAYEPPAASKAKIDAAFEREATDAAKRQEERYGRSQARLLDEEAAKNLQETYRRNNMVFRVSARITVLYKDQLDAGEDLAQVETQQTTIYSRGAAHADVDAAKESLTEAIDDFINADEKMGNSPIRIIIDPEAQGPPMEGASYQTHFQYRVWLPVSQDGQAIGDAN